MNTAKILVLLGSALIANTALASDAATIEKSLRPWQPLEVKKSKDAITVTLNQDMVTTQIYEAVARMGVCPSVWGAPDSYLKSVKEISILNKNKHSGFVLENPKSTCNEMGKATGDKANITLNANTHMF